MLTTSTPDVVTAHIDRRPVGGSAAMTACQPGVRLFVMTTPVRRRGPHTFEDWLAQPEERRLELIDGDFIEKAAPDARHGNAQAGTISTLRLPFHRRGGRGGPGGWWILSEVDVRLGDNVYRPDLVGWRRERVPELPADRPVTVRPDWICEALSPTHAANDKLRKLRRYHQAGVPHYWILDPEGGTLDVFRHEGPGYLNVLTAERHETVRAEPFDAIEVRVGLLLGDDPEE
jgi:Uma2 family endonuclease